MKPYAQMERSEQSTLLAQLKEEYEKVKAMGLKLDMSRGKPSREQLDLSEGMLNAVQKNEECTIDGVDARNYGLIAGLPSARRLFADLLGIREEMVIMGGSSSLTMMFNLISLAYTHGTLDSVRPWGKEEKIKFLCPSPGYDRHFAITQFFGFELICVPMREDGPDMDLVESLVRDPAVKGIWCVPKYSNPDGIVYSDAVIERLAAMDCAAPDFRIFYDNAYVIHALGEQEEIAEIFSLAKKYGHENRIYEFASTSKICFPGAGISCIAASEANIAFLEKQMFFQTIGPDKVNELRYIRFFGNAEGLKNYMKKHAEILAPRFRIVLDSLSRELAPAGLGHWHEPTGGYFISYFAPDGTAKRIVSLMKEAGVKMTGAGATYPYGVDPQDSNIRIAPSFPSREELQTAMDVFCLCVKIAALEKLS